MRTWIIIAALALAGCARAAEQAEQDFAFLESSKGSGDDACRAAGRVAYEWAERRDAAKYQEWKQTERIVCFNAAEARARGNLFE